MNHRAGLDRSQTLLFPESLEDYVATRKDIYILKRLEKVRTEWSLITLAYNLKRVLNLVSFEKLMAAVS